MWEMRTRLRSYSSSEGASNRLGAASTPLSRSDTFQTAGTPLAGVLHLTMTGETVVAGR